MKDSTITRDSDIRGTILYDGVCGFCGRFFRRYGSIFEHRGFVVMPLQSSGAAEFADRDQLLTQLHVAMPDRKLVGGADAVLVIVGVFWWMKPVVALARIGKIHRAMEFAYRFIAKNRYRIFGTCSLGAVCE